MTSASWNWNGLRWPRYCGGGFDFGDKADFGRGVKLFSEMVAKRYSKARPSTPVVDACDAQHQFGLRSILYRLKAKFDVRPITEQEVRATGLGCSRYA
jgi:hypothetical protein